MCHWKGFYRAFIGCILAIGISVNNGKAQPIAFPGAEGFGKYTTGGRGGKVFLVTNLNDNGEGSLRAAAEASGSRIVVFTVSGTIHLETPLRIRGHATIAGQTAPGDGICIADHPVILNGNNIIVRYMRFRMGDKNQRGGMVDGNGGDDAFSGNNRSHIIIDHCSMSWSTDEAFSIYNGDSTTLQWNLIAEPLNYSYHFEKGDKDYEHHGFGGIWGGSHTSAHHNLFAHCANRTPRFNGIRNKKNELVDFVNNVIYNWGNNNVYAGEGGNYNIVNNYYRYGPSTKKNVRSRIINPYKLEPSIPFGKFYVSGNYVYENTAVTKENSLGVVMNGGTEEDKKKSLISGPFAVEPVQSLPANEACELVLKYAGASLRRDTLDQRIIKNVRQGTGTIIDVQGGYPHGTDYSKTISAWPVLQSATSPVDSDKDGMPDEWEKQHSLNPTDPSDATAIGRHPYYTNIELYINSLVPAKK